ncbi:DUF1566 domain-containing protein [Oceanospirillum sediminis]|uniref:DUF1566 domain-containing protein n=1 Tax=Oceanospirillum sediminis TaxID=2760088 RepID=A0A839IY63_9GAMM|nr:DUF1566 domain-containing protein [Oceanospirillum sediminis]MBB1489379.1 DUF1566 domain-containing protein [Oceanospirillum sediminis]
MTEEEVTLSGQIAALIEAVGGWQSEAMKALQDALASAGGVDQAQLATLISQYLNSAGTLDNIATVVVQSEASTQKIQQEVDQHLAAPETLDNIATVVIQSAAGTQKIQQEVDQHLAAPETLAAVATAVVQSDSTAQQIQQLIDQYSAADVTDAVRHVLQYLPDTSGATGTTLADNYSNGQSVTFSPSGASTPSGAPVTWHLTDLVGVTAGSAEIPDGQSTQLTFTGPGSMTLTAMSNNVAAVPQVYTWGVSAGVMAKPSITSPTAGLTGVVLQPAITASAYSVSPTGYDTHQKSQFQALNTSGAVVWDSGEIAATTEIAVTTNWPAETELDIRVRYQGSVLGWGDWSALVRITTRTAGGLGYVYPDGGIGGPVVNGYQLIVAPYDQRSAVRHGLYYTDTTLLNIHRADLADPQSGWDNTNELINGYSDVRDNYGSTGPEAALYCRSLGADWFLPNKEELIAIFAVAAEIDAADTRQGLSDSSQYFWSSTEYDELKNWCVSPSDGYPDNTLHRMGMNQVLPVRREPV